MLKVQGMRLNASIAMAMFALMISLSFALAAGLTPGSAMAATATDGDGLTAAKTNAADGGELMAQSVVVSNPLVVADSSLEAGQRATWDCVWFGSYPQTEVTSSDSVYASLRFASWNADGDAWVGGAKYKRISRSDATDSGNWPSSAGTYRYFKYEPIKWRVLSVSGSTAFVVADIALDSQRYNANYAAVSWKTSGIRSWLNGYGASSNQAGSDFTSKNFIDTAFSAGEQSAIVPASAVYNDKVLLLSHSEVSGNAATAYGFSRDVRSESFIFEDRMCKGSDFADAMGAVQGYDNNVYWWIRLGQLDATERYADVVGDSGRVYENVGTAIVSAYAYGVRPALNLDLSSSYVTYAGTVSSKDSKVTRLAGDDRYQTMAKIVAAGFESSDYAVVATGENFPDALAANALAGAYNCPVVLTAKGSLSPEARSTLENLGVGHVFVMGGEAAVSAAAESQIAGMGIGVERVAGADRQATSLEALAKVKEKTGSVSTVIVATGYNFADTLSIGPWSYAHVAPIILTGSDGTLTPDGVAAIKALGGAEVVVVGGTAAVSHEVEDQVDVSRRLRGANRYETSAAIAEWELSRGLGLSAPAVATGENFPDALAGAALCGARGSVMVLASPSDTSAVAALAGAKGAYVFGGMGAVPASVEAVILKNIVE